MGGVQVRPAAPACQQIPLPGGLGSRGAQAENREQRHKSQVGRQEDGKVGGRVWCWEAWPEAARILSIQALLTWDAGHGAATVAW